MEVVVAFEVVLVVLLVLANGVFAMAEIAVVSSRKSRLRMLADAGDARAAAALALASDPNRFLSTVQVGITLVGVFAGAYGGATLAEPLAERLAGVPLIGRWSGGIAFTIVVVGITYLSLVVGELVPKRIALGAPERIARSIAGPMGALSKVATPLVALLSASTDGLLRLLRVGRTAEPPTSDEEVQALVSEGAAAGVFEPGESDIVENLFWFGDSRVADLMTPRPDLVWIDVDASAEAIRGTVAASGFSRYVVARGSVEDVVGIARTRDLLLAALAGHDGVPAEAVHPPLYVPESTPSLTLLERFRETGDHAALVVDEYGGIEGLVTVTDVLEALVGDLPGRDRAPEHPCVPREDGSLLLEGTAGLDDLEEAVREVLERTLGRTAPSFALPRDPGYRTLGGFVATRLRRLPAVGDAVVQGVWRFEVLDMDGRRVDKVLAARVEGPESRRPWRRTGAG
jgi:putative hemolysin